MSRRCKTLKIASEHFAALFGGGPLWFRVIKNALPADTTIINCRMSDDFRTLVLLLQSDQFEEVPVDCRFPEIVPALAQHLPSDDPYVLPASEIISQATTKATA